MRQQENSHEDTMSRRYAWVLPSLSMFTLALWLGLYILTQNITPKGTESCLPANQDNSQETQTAPVSTKEEDHARPLTSRICTNTVQARL